MKPWLRFVLVTVTVGGGFGLITGAFEMLRSDEAWKNPTLLAVVCIMTCVAVFVLGSGLMFVQNPCCIRPVQFAIALQIPWVSSHWFAYKMVCGIGLVGFIGAATDRGNIPGLTISGFGGYLGFQPAFGSYFNTSLSSHPWGIGINLVAVVLILLIRSSARRSSQTPVTAAPEHQRYVASAQ